MRKHKQHGRSVLSRAPLAAAIWLAISTVAIAQDDAAATDEAEKDGATLETITVTAQKRTENLQEVPISIQVLSPETLQEQNINDFDDFAVLLPSVSLDSGGPGFTRVYMRGVASGENGNHSGPQPSVGMYLDEQPITTITGALDVHIYDVERVEALAGPQGTLYGASSQAGTIRIITNKPDPSGFAAGYGLEANKISAGGTGYVGEGYLNLPLSEAAAIRLVGWTKEDAGYIDNVYGERTFPTSGITANNAAFVEDDYNNVTTTGARAALKLDFNENWSVTPTIMAQRQDQNGLFAYDEGLGELNISHGYPERADDDWRQIALTVQGKVGNFDLTYAFAHLKRDIESETDYSDYGFWYDTLLGYGTYFYDDNGDLVNPAQYIQAEDRFKKRSHEIRLASPSDERFRFVVGTFWQQQSHDIQQRYRIDNLASAISVPGWEDTIWLTKQVRQDHDEALFGEMSYDLTETLTATVGARVFKAENSLKGFFGFGAGYSGSTGEAACFDQTDFNGAPCINLDKSTDEDDWLGRFNLTWQITPDKMIYGTWSEGYRPGGINRRGTLPPYVSDFLTNWEAGWKTSWADNTVMWNGAVFQENWDDFQFSLLGLNGLTEIKNANQARIRGLESDLTWAATYNLRLSGGISILDAELTENYCGFTDDDGNPVTACAEPEAPSGTRLPISAKFKGNVTARYTWDSEREPYFQATLVHEGKRESDLRLEERDILGDLPSYTTLDLSAGFRWNNMAIDFFLRNATDEVAEFSRFVQCPETVCGAQRYISVNQPRTFGVRFSQEF
ncbi:TonB-dependent receptor [Ahniella affigens]|uniref:TonB-dependent receptor n=1 Tax=Ahniella affigens TaxID=2021234 RepID=A0A2P1PMP1_9GAMM|nr:TonB-dependent receptor [Ahniella affigens]AVP96108.1 TonB-dependent receptor [Ahniella affigens]